MQNTKEVTLKLSGLLGGHSGIAFSNMQPENLASRISAAEVMADIFDDVKQSPHIIVKQFDVGTNATNQIPKAVEITFYVEQGHEQDLADAVNEIEQRVNTKLDKLRAKKKSLTEVDIPRFVIETQTGKQQDSVTLNMNTVALNEAALKFIKGVKPSQGKQRLEKPFGGVSLWALNTYTASVDPETNMATVGFYKRAMTTDAETQSSAFVQQVVDQLSMKEGIASSALTLEPSFAPWKTALDNPWLQKALSVAEKIIGKQPKISAMCSSIPQYYCPHGQQIRGIFRHLNDGS